MRKRVFQGNTGTITARRKKVPVTFVPPCGFLQTGMK